MSYDKQAIAAQNEDTTVVMQIVEMTGSDNGMIMILIFRPTL